MSVTVAIGKTEVAGVMARALRASLSRSGEPIDLAYRRRIHHSPKLVLLCNASKSMDLYSDSLLQFVRAFQYAYCRIKTFVFSTALHHITPILRHSDIELLRDSMHQLQRQSRCLIRPNPLLGSVDDKLAARDMAATLPPPGKTPTLAKARGLHCLKGRL